MPKFQPKTSKQIRAIFGLGKKVYCTKEDLEEMASDVTNGRVDRLSLLSFGEANAMIRRLGGEPFPAMAALTPRRTVNYRRQQAGVQQIAQPQHLKLMRDLAAGRNMTDAGLQSMGLRMLKHWPPHTTDETNKIIEAIKAMNARDAAKPKEAA
jgi:hypothetical protein